jgi:hypothetical protein
VRIDGEVGFSVRAYPDAGRFILRGEAAYLLTGDTAGDDPLVHNNRVEYLAGFDVNLPLGNLNLNVQNRGPVILHSGGIGPGYASPCGRAPRPVSHPVAMCSAPRGQVRTQEPHPLHSRADTSMGEP